jgi:hypothetical protein
VKSEQPAPIASRTLSSLGRSEGKPLTIKKYSEDFLKEITQNFEANLIDSLLNRYSKFILR